MNNHKELAKSYFLEGYNCAQAVVLAFHKELGLDKETAARMASAFGGGMGRLREVCGTVSGMLLVLGLLRGYSDPKDLEGKKELYSQVQQLARTFREHNKSIICRELLGLDHHSDEPTPSLRTPEYYKKRPCADLAADAAKILEDLLGGI
ncbi:MAG: C_GCAxxG_C_C family protein [Lachnospiraceae bacterium]|nr:C_GCAxxG_C_C family protein [Lachnospiraceae bacterium]